MSLSAAAPSIGMPSASATATGTWSGRVQRRQPHPEDAIREVREGMDGESEREGRLAGATGADKGQQPDAWEEGP